MVAGGLGAPGGVGGTDGDPVASQVAVGIETDRGLWVQALGAAGYQVFAVNPLAVSLSFGLAPSSNVNGGTSAEVVWLYLPMFGMLLVPDTILRSLALGAILALIPTTILWGRTISPWIIPFLMVGFLVFGAVRGVRIYEVFISYYGRTYAEGKKIGYKDGFRAIYCILKYNLLR